MRSLRHQQGFLLIAGAFLVVTIAAFSVGTAFLHANLSATHADRHSTANAFYLAEAGIERALFQLHYGTPCDVIPLKVASPITFGGGQIAVSTTNYEPSPQRSLLFYISSSASTIRVTGSLSGYAPSGRIKIDNELIDYTGISTTGACSTSYPCFTGAQRGVGGTTATPHSAFSVVSQTQCNIIAHAAVPNLANPISENKLKVSATSSSIGWMAGRASGSERIYKVTGGDNFSVYPPQFSILNADMRGMAYVADDDIWLVGKEYGMPNVAHWNGVKWTGLCLHGAIPNKDLFTASCTHSNSCWALGDKTILHFDGTSWSNSGFSMSVPMKKYYGSTCVGGQCWAVGQREGGNALIIHWNGSAWSRVLPDASAPNVDLLSVACASTDDCFAVGKEEDDQGATVLQWDGSIWKRVILPGDEIEVNLRAVTCLASNDCWAVGDVDDDKPVFLHWNGTQWTRHMGDSTVKKRKMRTVSCAASNLCYAAGNFGEVNKWDGYTWSRVETHLTDKKHIYTSGGFKGGGLTTFGWEELD